METNAAIFNSRDFVLENGATLPILGNTVCGDKANAEWNTVLQLHGYTSNPHAAGGGDSNQGWWENLIGPGAPSTPTVPCMPNMLGSYLRNNGTKSINPGYQSLWSRYEYNPRHDEACHAVQNSARKSLPPLSAILTPADT